MRFIKYINESSDINTLLKDTKNWWDYCNKQGVKNKFLWRGISQYNKEFKKIKTRTNRKPTDTCSKYHELSDNIFYKLFKIHARSNTVFCSPDMKHASHYGDYISIIVPIGKFNYIWSPEINDLLVYMSGRNREIYNIICNSEDLFDEYDVEYGEKSENGTWYYEDKDTKEKFKDEALKNIYDNTDNNTINRIKSTLKWVPTKEYNEWKDEEIKNSKNKAYDLIKNNYIMNKGFKNLMDNLQNEKIEIMLDCKEYYSINKDWAEKFLSPII